MIVSFDYRKYGSFSFAARKNCHPRFFLATIKAQQQKQWQAAASFITIRCMLSFQSKGFMRSLKLINVELRAMANRGQMKSMRRDYNCKAFNENDLHMAVAILCRCRRILKSCHQIVLITTCIVNLTTSRQSTCESISRCCGI